MKQPRIISREYKAMLRSDRFSGGERKLLAAANAFWRDFSDAVADVVITTSGELTTNKPPRLISFYDTTRQHLNRNHYIFRERRLAESGEREVTLKFRHPDRYVTRGRTMKARIAGSDGRTKFEEDVKGPFQSLYSFSTTLPVGRRLTFGTLGHVATLFPDIRKRIDGFDSKRPIRAVNRFTAREQVIVGAAVRVGKSPKVDAESALIVWHDDHGPTDRPVAVEFSFRYGDDKEGYEGATAQRAFKVFDVLQTRLPRWVDPDGPTKTAFVYG